MQLDRQIAKVVRMLIQRVQRVSRGHEHTGESTLIQGCQLCLPEKSEYRQQGLKWEILKPPTLAELLFYHLCRTKESMKLI
jgi:hypothetical protein